jgi:hypothetical protein
VDESKVNSATAFIYFIAMNFITYCIMLNLFLLVTLEQYMEFARKDDNPIERFGDILTEFKKAWNKYSSESDSGFRIKSSQFTNFLLNISGDLERKDEERKIERLKKYQIDLKLKT